MRSFLLPYLLISRPLAYAFIFFGMIFEGDIILFTAAFLARLGYLNPAKTILVVAVGLLIGETFWYQIGVWLRETKVWLFVRHWIERLTNRFNTHLAERTARTLFISKFMYGLGHLMVVKAGLLNIEPKKIWRKDSLAVFMWFLIVASLGFFSSATLIHVRHYLRFTEIALLSGLLVFILLEFLIGRLSDLE
ncbi:MAG: hypothetical protein HY220_02120 [Candidatus Sungbacteria bacterium]|uniref:DedA family protein n=1 Tax=Candidatus Sungiibacteriota bacterium TaxID=2750080 RepID=A0A9D6LNC8_9BACT|nr:hypothetical protein [Candidatus Sungbacteria bacterium]